MIALTTLLLAALTVQEPTAVGGFPAYLWRLEYRTAPLPAPLLSLAGGCNVERADGAEWVLERGARFYVGHAAGRNELHLERDTLDVALARNRFAATRDPRGAVRYPCLNDPATRSDLLEQLNASLSAPDRDRADFISLGDEVSITPWGDPAEVCRSPHCDAAFERWVVAGGGARYGVAPGAPRPATDAVLTAPSADRLGAWLAARAFQRAVLTEVLVELAEHARARLPEVPVALLGLVGETPFGGVDLEGLGDVIQVLEPYRVADAVERCATLRALGRGPTTILRTVFLEEHDPPSLRATLGDLVDSPVDGVVLWSDRELARREELHGALGSGLDALRADRSERPDRDRDPRGVALLHSDDSLAHGFLRDARGGRLSWTERLAGHQERHGYHEVRRRLLLENLRADGADPGAIDVAAVGPGLVERFPHLIALDLAVVSDDELSALRAFEAAGGRLEVIGAFAALRPDGSLR